MVGWIILAILLALLLALLMMPLRVCFTFGQNLSLWVKIGPKKIVLLPKVKKETLAEAAVPTEEKPAKAKKERPKPTRDEVIDLLRQVWRGVRKLLRRMGRHITIDPVECYATIGGSDPALVAETFGYCNTAMWTVLPFLQETCHMPRPEVHVRMDFDAPGITAEGKLGIKFTLGGVVHVGLGLLGPVLGWLLRFLRAAKKRQKVAAKAQPATSAPAEQTT